MSRGPTFAALLLAAQAARAAAQVAPPQQRWTNYGSAPGELAVTWSSSTTTDLVGYRLAPFADPPVYTWAKAPELASYASPPTSKLPAYTSLIIHRSYLTGLPLATELEYVVAVDSADPATFTAPARLFTHPGVGPDVASTLLVLADVAKRPNVVAALEPRLPGFTAGGIILGDLAYANGDNAVWDDWQKYFDPISSKMPICPNAGNHEMTGEPGFVAFKTRFGAAPYLSPTFEDSQNLFYSWEVGAMHIIVLSSFSDYARGSPQMLFLEQDLARVNRSVTPWLIVGMHAPWYNANTQHFLQLENMRVLYEPLLLAARVNVVLVGHVHAFQRTPLLAADGLVVDGSPGAPAGILHWMAGMSGKSLYPNWRMYPRQNPATAPNPPTNSP